MSDKPWLSDDEVIELTGYRVPAYQMRWLDEHHIKAHLNRLNKVRVPRNLFDSYQAAKAKKRTEPDFSKVRKAS
jgi:hypothetical protein